MAVHERLPGKHHYSTIKDHLPGTHQWVKDWNPQTFITWAGRIGPQAQCAIEWLLGGRAHPEQAYKSCRGVLHLEKKVGKERLERACDRDLSYQSVSYKVTRSILDRGLDSLPEQPLTPLIVSHENLRGAGAYQ